MEKLIVPTLAFPGRFCRDLWPQGKTWTTWTSPKFPVHFPKFRTVLCKQQQTAFTLLTPILATEPPNYTSTAGSPLVPWESTLNTAASSAVVCKEKYTKERTVRLIVNECDSLSLRRNSITVQPHVAGGETSSVTHRERGFTCWLLCQLFKFPALESVRSLYERE